MIFNVKDAINNEICTLMLIFRLFSRKQPTTANATATSVLQHTVGSLHVQHV